MPMVITRRDTIGIIPGVSARDLVLKSGYRDANQISDVLAGLNNIRSGCR